MNRKVILFAIGFVFVSLLAVYAFMGGFRSIPVEKVPGDTTLFLSGAFYSGKYESDSVEQLFNHARSKIEQGAWDFPLVMAYFKKPGTFPDTAQVFIGAVNRNSPDTTFRFNGLGISAFTRNYLVIPNRKRVEEKIANKLQEDLRPVVIESYYADDHIEVGIPY